jgi:hypothetical protein
VVPFVARRHVAAEPSKHTHTHINIYTHVLHTYIQYACMHIYIYIYIERERERERERENYIYMRTHTHTPLNCQFLVGDGDAKLDAVDRYHHAHARRAEKGQPGARVQGALGRSRSRRRRGRRRRGRRPLLPVIPPATSAGVVRRQGARQPFEPDTHHEGRNEKEREMG